MYAIFVHDELFASGGSRAPTAGGSLATAFLHALPRLPPRGRVLVFYPHTLWFLHITGCTPSPFFRPITIALDTALVSPARSFTGFWASPKWTWPGRGPDWMQRLRNWEAQEYFSLPHPGRELPSQELMFEEWASDFSFPDDDYR
jgi:hypothetical protein